MKGGEKMEKKNLVFLSVIAVVFLLSVTFVSAGWWSNLVGKEDSSVTGNAITSTCRQYTSCQKFKEIWVDKINPYSQNYISFNTDALVQYSANGQNKNTYGFDTNGGRITANNDLTLEPSRYIVTKSKALVHYSSDGNIKHTVELQSDGTRFTTPFDLIFDPSRYVVAKTDAIVQYSKDGQNKNTYGFDAKGGRITANGDLTLDPSRNVVVKSLVLVSPDGTQWKLKVSNSGQLSTERVNSTTTI
jgi:hypothetical protein